MKKTPSGFSLIELIIVAVLLSIILPASAVLLGGIARKGVRAEEITVETDLAREIMEEIRSRRFDENENAGIDPPAGAWTTLANMGPDTVVKGTNTPGEPNEVAQDKSTYDDVDDFGGFSEFPVPGFPKYNRTVSVVYVAPSVDWATNASVPTNYKRVIVEVIDITSGERVRISILIAPLVPDTSLAN